MPKCTRRRRPTSSFSAAGSLMLSLLLLSVCMQDVSAHLGRIYKSARALEQSGRSEGRKFPILRALVSQFISDRSARDMSPAVVGVAGPVAGGSLAASPVASSSAVSPKVLSSSSLAVSGKDASPVNDNQSGVAAASTNKARHAEMPSKPNVASSASSSSSKSTSSSSTSNVKTIQHIIEDINSQNSKISTKRRKHFLVNILSRMLKSVNFTEVSAYTIIYCHSHSFSLRFS